MNTTLVPIREPHQPILETIKTIVTTGLLLHEKIVSIEYHDVKDFEHLSNKISGEVVNPSGGMTANLFGNSILFKENLEVPKHIFKVTYST